MLELLNQLDGFEANNKIKASGSTSRPWCFISGLCSAAGPAPPRRDRPLPAASSQVLMATNRLDILDSALLRPGRIDRKIEIPNPNEESRHSILKIHSRKMNLMRGIDLKKVAGMMNGASGAELKACCTEAGMFALRERRVHVTQEDFEMAVAKVMKKDSDKNMSIKKLWK